MLPTEQRDFFALVQRCLGEYLKPPTQADLEAWWLTCKVFSLEDVRGALGSHQMDPEDGHKPPRPVDIKRKLVARKPVGGHCELSQQDPSVHELLEYYRQRDEYAKRVAAAPSVKQTAHAIALRHGNKPWGGSFSDKDIADLA